MKRINRDDELKMMTDTVNEKNLENFQKKLLPYFFLSDHATDVIFNQVINKQDIDNNLYLDKLFDLNNQRRAFFDISSYKDNTAYKIYRYILLNKYKMNMYTLAKQSGGYFYSNLS